MDPLTHTLFGAAAAEAGLRRTTALATPTLLIAVNLPDLDAVTYFMGNDLSLWLRRGWTHGVLAMVLLPLVLAGAMLLYERIRGPSAAGAAHPRRLLALACFGVWSHPALDWLNTYGVRLLMPFDGTWFYGDTLYIIDPWLWLLLGGAVCLGRSQSWPARLAWGALAVAATAVVFAGASSPLVRILWTAGLATIVLLRSRLPAPHLSPAPRWALAAAGIYVLALMVGSRMAEADVREALADAGIDAVEDLLIGPLPASPHRRDVVVVTPAEYRWGTYAWFRQPRLQLDPRRLDRPRADDPTYVAARSAPCLKGMDNWLRYPFLDVQPGADGTEVMLLDARYTRGPTRGFGGARVRLDAHGDPTCPTEDRPSGDRGESR